MKSACATAPRPSPTSLCHVARSSDCTIAPMQASVALASKQLCAKLCLPVSQICLCCVSCCALELTPCLAIPIPPAAGAYSHAVKARGMVYVSGMIGMEAKVWLRVSHPTHALPAPHTLTRRPHCEQGKKVVKVKKPKLRDPPEFMREEDRLAQIADNERRWKKYLHDCLVLETNKVSTAPAYSNSAGCSHTHMCSCNPGRHAKICTWCYKKLVPVSAMLVSTHSLTD